MRKQWRIIWSLTAMAGLCWFGGRVMGQADDDAPQYPQYVQYPQGAPPVTPAAPGAPVTLTPDQIDQLIGPIALYPDPLLSLVFPAATYPQDVVAAEQWLSATPNPTEAAITAQNWDDSIKGLVHYPTVLKMMSDQPDWTQALGAAFLNQQKDVLASVQRLRAEAQAAKNLETNQQEQVVSDDGSILIEPVDPDMIYVPQYDPDLVYAGESPISFGVGFPIGLWCDNDFDWNGGFVAVGGGWYSGWHHPSAWDQHPPRWWNGGRTGWAGAPRPWARASRGPAPRLTPGAVGHLGLDRPRGVTAANSAPGGARKSPTPIRRQPAPEPSKNAFESPESRDEVQRDVQRARPAPVQKSEPVREAPQQRAAPARAEPRAEAPEAPRSNNAFEGGSGGEARAQSARGNASGRR